MFGNNPKDLILRQIQQLDDPKKLSLGDESHVPLKTFLRRDAYEFHQYEIAKTYVLVEQDSYRIWAYITLTNCEVDLRGIDSNNFQRP